MQVLLTGGSGFIGRHLGAALAARGDAVVNLDLVRPRDGAPFVRSVLGDVRDPAAVRDALAGCEAVFHLAAAHHDFGIERATFFDVNEQGARVLCAAMTDAGIRHACFYSTVAVYGDAPGRADPADAAEQARGGRMSSGAVDDEHDAPDETTPPRPLTPYGESKLAGERVFAEWAAAAPGRRVTVLRPSVVFGEHHFANMYSLVRQIHGRRFLQVGAGANYKSLAFVHNLVAATLYLFERDAPDAYEVYNYADKPDLRSAEIAAAVYAALGRRVPRGRLPLGFALLLATPLDLVSRLTGRNFPVSRARIRKLAEHQTRFAAQRVRDAGFVPPHTLQQGIETMVQWYLREGRALPPARHLPPSRVQARLEPQH